jgi:hypothetical protein
MEVLSEFIEACAESAELFEVREGAFDAISLAVESTVERPLHFAQAARRLREVEENAGLARCLVLPISHNG